MIDAIGWIFIKIKFPLFIPNSKFAIFWDVLMIFLCVVHFYFLIFDLCFYYNFENNVEFTNFYSIWVRSITIFFIFDLLLKFNEGYFVHGAVILDQKAIIRKYLRSEFCLDICSFSSLIFDGFCLSDPKSHYIGYLFKLIFFFKYPVLNKLLNNFEEFINFDEKLEAFIALIKLFLKMLFLAHIVACLWLTLAYATKNQENWIEMKGISDKSAFLKYELSLYWAFVTIATIGYGDITPQNEYEYMFAIIVIVSGSIFFGYSLSCIASIFKDLEKEELKKK